MATKIVCREYVFVLKTGKYVTLLTAFKWSSPAAMHDSQPIFAKLGVLIIISLGNCNDTDNNIFQVICFFFNGYQKNISVYVIGQIEKF